MEAKAGSVIVLAVVALILVFVFPAIVDTLGTKTDDIPADSRWNSGNDLLETLWLPVLAAIIIGVWVLFKNGIGGGGV